jgi:anti-anti-sigma factor
MRENPQLQTPHFAAISHEDDRGALTIVVSGELDMATVPKVERELRGAESERGQVILDLRRLEFIDSSGLHLIIAAHTRIREAGGRLVIVRAPELVHRVFTAARLDQLLEMVPEGVIRCPACRGTIAASERLVEVNGCQVHVACARDGVYEDVPTPDWGHGRRGSGERPA